MRRQKLTDILAREWRRLLGRWPRFPPAQMLTPQSWDRAEPGRGRLADAPWRIPALGWKDILWRTYENLGRANLPSVAGGISFYVLLAIFPAIAAFISIYGFFLDPGTIARHLQGLSAILPDAALELIGGQMTRLGSQGRGVLSVTLAASTLFSVWSANAAMKALVAGLNIAYSETEKRSFLKRTLFTYAATLSSVIFLAAFVLLTVAAPVWLHALGFHRLMAVWGVLRWLVVYLIAAAAFILAYRYGPSRRPARWRWVSIGGAAAALLWMIGSLVFSFLLDHFGRIGVTYGSLSAVIGLLLWVWFSLMVLLIGAELNAEIEHQTALDTTAGPPAPLGERGATMADTVGKAFTLSADEARQIAQGFARGQINRLLHIAPGDRHGSPPNVRGSPPDSPAGRPGPRRSGAR
jgi:membrane protein